jgi:hypothetical protein
MSEAGLIFKKIPEIMSQMDAVGKNKRNTQGAGFNYRGIDDVYIEMQKRLAKAGVFCLPDVLEEDRQERTSKSGGNLTFTRLKIRYTFCASDGSSVSATVMGEAMDSGDKSISKAMSIAQKYAFFQVFCIPAEEAVDPDAESHELDPVEKPSSVKQIPTETKQVPTTRPQAVTGDPGEYVIMFGKYRGKKIKDISIKDLESYRAYLYKSATDAKPLTPNAKDYINAVDAWVNVKAERLNQDLGFPGYEEGHLPF